MPLQAKPSLSYVLGVELAEIEAVCTFLLRNSTAELNISFCWLQNKKYAFANSAGEANFWSLPLLICPSRAVVSLNADVAPLASAP